MVERKQKGTVQVDGRFCSMGLGMEKAGAMETRRETGIGSRLCVVSDGEWLERTHKDATEGRSVLGSNPGVWTISDWAGNAHRAIVGPPPLPHVTLPS